MKRLNYNLMKLLKLFFFFLIAHFTIAQNREDVNVGPIYKSLVNEIDNCIQSDQKNCNKLLDTLVRKGKKEKVKFLDFLYCKKAFYFMTKTEIDSAMHYCRLTLDNLNPEEKYRSDLEAYNILANCYYYKGNLDQAIKNYLQVAKILEDGGNQLHLGYLYSNIATILGESGNDDKQIEYLLKSYKLLEENKDEKFIATVASNLGYGYYFKKDTSAVYKWINKSLNLANKSNDLVAKTQSNNILSLIQKDMAKALIFSQESVKYAEQMGNPIYLASSYYRFAEVLDHLNRPEEALNYAEKSVQYAKEVGDNVTLMKASFTAAKINYKNGNKSQAADYYHDYSILKDSISSVENAKEANELNTKYETEKKEKQIAEQELKIQKQRANLLYAILGGVFLILIIGGIYIYNRKTQKIKIKQLQQEKENAILNSFIQGEERERSRISHELHDSVAAMIGAAKMSLETIPHLPEEKQREHLSKVVSILENTHADVRHIAHNLLPVVLEKEGIIKATQHFASEINETKLLNVSVVNENSKTEQLPQQLQLMLFRVVQELINNIIKHSQAQNAVITFSRNSDGLQIEVSDDGIGFDGGIQDGDQGLYSISQRLKSIGGNFRFTKKNDRGMQAVAEIKI